MIVLPNSERPLAIADWLETSLLTQDVARISDTAMLDAFSEADFDDPDALLAEVMQTVRARQHIVGPEYPIERDGLGFSRRDSWQDHLPYSFMLFVSLNQTYAELTFAGGTANLPAELFEVLASKALEKYADLSVIRIGAPRRQPVPGTFPAALDYAVTKLSEVIGQRDLEDHNSGDDGVDLIGWKPFGDNRASQAIILAQCAIGLDWGTKRDGVSLELWRRHIDWHSGPVKGFAVPFHVEQGRPWRETATRAGIVFDRLRIARLVKPASLSNATRVQIARWCTRRIRAIQRLAIEP